MYKRQKGIHDEKVSCLTGECFDGPLGIGALTVIHEGDRALRRRRRADATEALLAQLASLIAIGHD